MKKLMMVAAALATVAMVAPATAQDAPAPAPSPDAATAYPYTTAVTPLGTILDDPAAKAVVDKYIPGLTDNPNIDQGRGLTLKQIAGYMQGKVTDETLTSIDADFAKLPKPAAQ